MHIQPILHDRETQLFCMYYTEYQIIWQLAFGLFQVPQLHSIVKIILLSYELSHEGLVERLF